jgi:sigma-B regulation protein RsbU (phosphoserine phosphatase)
VRVGAHIDADIFTMTVANSCDPIPEDAMLRLFEPFSREDVRPSQQGLGLGLYIASENRARPCWQTPVQSNAEERRFTIQMPLSQRA